MSGTDPGGGDDAGIEDQLVEEIFGGSEGTRDRLGIEPREGSGPWRLSPNQRRLWFIHRYRDEDVEYNSRQPLRLRGPLDVEALETALETLLERHETLRTAYGTDDDGTPVQRVLDPPSVDLAPLDAAPASPERSEQVVRDVLAEELHRPFDLETGPVCRFRLVRLAEEDHVLVVTVHHIAFDGRSWGILRRELAELYEARLQGREPDLDEPPIQYADYAEWQRDRLDDGDLDDELAYWRDRLRDAPALDLPTDHPRPETPTGDGAVVSTPIPPDARERVHALSERSNVTPFMVVLAGFKVLLTRYTGQEDVTVGTVQDGRSREELEDLVGFFVNTLALRTDLSGDPSFHELLDRVRDTCLEGYEHQEAPLERLVADLEPDRGTAGHPLVQVMALYEDAREREPVAPADLEAESVEAPRDTAKFDLVLTVEETPERMQARLRYNTDVFDAGTAERLVEHYRNLLASLTREPGDSIHEARLLAEPERRTLLEDWSHTPHPEATARPPNPDPPPTLPHRIQRRAHQSPQAPAVHTPATTLTYADLNRRANQVAGLLRDRDLPPQSPVAVALHRTPWLPAAFLGIQKAGHVYVPLDPQAPPARHAHVLDHTQPPLVLTHSRNDTPLPPDAPTLALDRTPLPAPAPDLDPDEGPSPTDTAYVIHTSGTTGEPKGVPIRQRAAARLATAQQAVFDVGPGDRVLQAASPSFDASIWEFLMALCSGATLCLPQPDAVLTGATLARELDRTRTTIVTLTPTALAPLPADASLDTVHTLVTAGEPLPQELVDRWAPDLDFYNAYGPTEATICATISPCQPRARSEATDAETGLDTPPPIGTPWPGRHVYLLDEHGNPVPPGVPGEIHVGGPDLTPGYLDRPEANEDAFTDPPIPTPAGVDRLYRTGDRAEWTPDGELVFRGREDDQLQLRGHRVEPGEIQTTLERHDAVNRALVLPHPDDEDPHNPDRLLAYATPHPHADDEDDRTPAPETLEAHLDRHLPDYMVPDRVLVLDAFPRTPTGKVDRQALPTPEPRATSQHAPTPPRTPTETLVADAYQGLLDVDHVGVHDDFFELGGHSLLATQLANHLEGLLDTQLSVREVFTHPTPAQLGTHLDRRDTDPLPPIPHDPDREQARLSHEQQRLWFIQAYNDDLTAYNVPELLRVQGPLDVDALVAALGDLQRRHAVLRTTYPTDEDGNPRQRVHDEPLADLDVADLSGAPDPRDRALEICEREAARPFDLTERPCRFRLLRLGGEDHVLVLHFHHLVTDAWSRAPLFDDVAEAYEARRGDREPAWEPLPVQYPDYAEWQREALDNLVEDELDYWTDQLAGLEPLELPTDRARPPEQTYEGATHRFTVPEDAAGEVRELARDSDATLYMALLAAFQALLARYARRRDLAVGTPVAGRTHRDLRDLVGFFVNTLVLRTDLSGDPTFRELLDRVRETCLEAYDHQHVPFAKLVDELDVERDPSRTPLAQVVFNLVDRSQVRAERALNRVEDLETEPLSASPNEAKFDLQLNVVDGDDLEATLTYSTALFEPETVEHLAGHYRRLLAELARDPDRPVHEIPLQTREERRQRSDWRRGPEVPVPDGCLHEAFQAQAEATPDRTALVSGDRRVSYRELARRANRLAHHLRSEHDVGPGTRVPLLLDPGPDLVTAVWATLQAGGCYVPLNPGDPPRRRGHVLDDADPAVLVTRQAHVDRARLPEGLEVTTPDPARDPDLPTSPPSSGASPDDLAYVLYTSGTTGQPKGVEVTHRNVLATGAGLDDRLYEPLRERLGRPLHVTLNATVAFDASVKQLLRLTYGDTVHQVSRAQRRDPERLSARLRREGVDVFNCTPSQLDRLLDVEGASPLDPVELLLVGGEPVPPDLWSRLARRDDLDAYNIYGPTETTIVSTAQPIEPDTAPRIGVPLPNERVYVLDDRRNPTPVNAPGQLFLAGPGVARGYRDRPDETSDRFLPDPFGDDPEARVYATGDLARWRPDGTLEFLGRRDDQLQVRGHRVEPGEIRAVLAEHPGVRRAVVSADDDGPDTRLHAYVVPDPDADDPTPRALHDRATRRLPDYMTPTSITLLDEVPLTPNGKVDHDALPEPSRRLDPEAALTPPRGPTEEVVVAAYRDLLDVDRVGVRDDFFELGGHSLLATQLTTRLADTLDRSLPVRALFDNPTPAQLATHLDRRRPAREALPPIPRDPDRRQAPLSHQQQRLWFLHDYHEDLTAYNVPRALRLRGPLDEEALRAALRDIQRRHAVLRTTYHADEDGRPVQRVHGKPLADLDVADLASLDPGNRPGRARQLVREVAWAPFALDEAPCRFALVRLDEGDHVLVLSVHHVATDGWSTTPLFRDLAHAYRARVEGEVPELPELPVQYADYAAWQREVLDDVVDDEVAYWTERLEGLDPVELPADRRGPPEPTHEGATHAFAIPDAAAHDVRERAREADATPFMVLLAAFQALLARHARREDVAVGTPVAGRHREELEDLVGFFVNTLVLRTDLSGDPTFRELLDRVRDTCLEAYEHQRAPFETLVAELAPDRDPGRNPLVRVLFNLAEAPREAGAALASSTGLETEPVDVEAEGAKFDLELTIVQGDELRGTFVYNADLFEAATVERLARHYRRLLEACARDPGRRVDRVRLAPEPERRRLLEEAAGPERAYETDRLLHERFRAPAQADPDRVAVAAPGGSLDRGGLRSRADRLARRLRARGVEAGTPVGLLVEDGRDLVAGVLAVEAAAGVLVPLDPDSPDDRLARLAREADPALVATGAGLDDRLPEAVPELCLDETAPDEQVPEQGPEGSAGPDGLALVAHPDVGPERPPGVEIDHASRVNRLCWTRELLDLDAGDRVLAAGPLEAGIAPIPAALAAGATLLAPCTGADPDRIARRAREGEATVIHLPADALAELLASEDLAALPSLEAVVAVGEGLAPDAAARFRERFPDADLHLVCGPPEAAGAALHASPDPDRERVGPAGRGVANACLHVLDGDGDRAPPGVPGELFVGGAPVARGYRDRPEATREAFVPDPFDDDPEARLYRTGLRARARPGDGVEVRGRRDRRAWVAGRRVHPDALETRLARREGVRRALVLAREAEGRRRLIAYLERGTGSVDPEAVRAAAAERWPEAALPDRFVVRDELPERPDGTVDREALPDPEPREGAREPPRTPAEETLAGIWAEVLAVDEGAIGRREGFSELGGDAGDAERVAARVEEVYGLDVDADVLEEHPTLAELGEAVDARLAELVMGATEDQLDDLAPSDGGA